MEVKPTRPANDTSSRKPTKTLFQLSLSTSDGRNTDSRERKSTRRDKPVRDSCSPPNLLQEEYLDLHTDLENKVFFGSKTAAAAVQILLLKIQEFSKGV